MPGAGVQGVAGVKVGLEALQKALPTLPMGSDLHSSVLKAISDISKHVGSEGLPQPDQGDKIQALLALARNAGGAGAPPPGLGPMAPPAPVPPGPPPPGL